MNIFFLVMVIYCVASSNFLGEKTKCLFTVYYTCLIVQSLFKYYRYVFFWLLMLKFTSHVFLCSFLSSITKVIQKRTFWEHKSIAQKSVNIKAKKSSSHWSVKIYWFLRRGVRVSRCCCVYVVAYQSWKFSDNFISRFLWRTLKMWLRKLWRNMIQKRPAADMVTHVCRVRSFCELSTLEIVNLSS